MLTSQIVKGSEQSKGAGQIRVQNLAPRLVTELVGHAIDRNARSIDELNPFSGLDPFDQT
jgi:hypothetical protein